MTDFHINVVRITNVRHHPNGDKLDIIDVHDGYPSIVQRDYFKVGDLAVYIPIDTTLPDREYFAFLKPSERKHLRAKKIRGTFSMGLLIDNVGHWEEGTDVAEELGITRFEPKEEIDVNGCDESPPQILFPHYTDIENLRKYHYVFSPQEEVILHEKIHGENSRFVHDGTRLWVGSHTRVKKDLSTSPEFKINSKWWRIAKQFDFEKKLSKYPNKIFYGELFGCVKDLKYGFQNNINFVLFDIFDINTQQYINYDFALDIANDLNIPWVPEIYRGPWTTLQDYLKYAEGNSLMIGANNIREGFVMRPKRERWHPELGRVIVKLHGEGFLLR